MGNNETDDKLTALPEAPAPAESADTAETLEQPAEICVQQPATSEETAAAQLPPTTAGDTVTVGGKTADKKSPDGAPVKPVDRAQIGREKAKIDAALRRKVMIITGLMNLSCAIIILCIYFLTKTNNPGVITVISLVLAADLIFLGYMSMIVFRYWHSGKKAMAEFEKRQRSVRAKRLLKQYTNKLSSETQMQLMRANDSTSRVDGAAMFLQLQDDELSNALQFLCMTSRTGELKLVFSKNGKTGAIYLADSTLVHASFDEHVGLPALARMLLEGGAELSLYEGRIAETRTLELPVSQILLEASVMSDEMGS